MKKYFVFSIISMMIGMAGCSQSPETSNEVNKTEISPENLTTVNIKVEGMTCTGCEQSIVSKLEKKEGVQTAEASHTEAIAKITYDKSKLTEKNLAEVIESAGYTVEGTE
jgi:copper chaperone CopZ